MAGSDCVDKWKQALELLPLAWRSASEAAGGIVPEEIRLRVGRNPSLLLEGKETCFREETVSEALLQKVMEKATGASMHAAAPALSEGFVSYKGLRIGVCGTAVYRDGVVSGFRNLSSLAIRVPRECRGICDKVYEHFALEGFRSTLIIGPPGEGKTTALRELIRRLSDGGTRVGVADERNELAAMDRGEAQFDLGRCSDVLTGVWKGKGAMMLLRGMNPQILAMDEITREEDLEAVLQVSGCGVGVLATAHGSDPAELSRRRLYRRLLEENVFAMALTVRRSASGRSYELENLRS